MVSPPHSATLVMLGPKRGKRDVDAACPTCAPVASDMHVQERSPMPDDLSATRR